jgi:hypothetical protein
MSDPEPLRRRHVVRNPAVLWRRTLEGVMVLGTGSDEVQVLEPPGDEIWAALGEPIDLAALAATLAARHGAEPEVVRTDVEQFVARLLDQGLALDAEPPDPTGSAPSGS